MRLAVGFFLEVLTKKVMFIIWSAKKNPGVLLRETLIVV